MPERIKPPKPPGRYGLFRITTSVTNPVTGNNMACAFCRTGGIYVLRYATAESVPPVGTYLTARLIRTPDGQPAAYDFNEPDRWLNLREPPIRYLVAVEKLEPPPPGIADEYTTLFLDLWSAN